MFTVHPTNQPPGWVDIETAPCVGPFFSGSRVQWHGRLCLGGSEVAAKSAKTRGGATAGRRPLFLPLLRVTAAAIEAQPGVANGAAVRWRRRLCGSAPVRSPRSVLTVALLRWMVADPPTPKVSGRPAAWCHRSARVASGVWETLPAHRDCRVNGLSQCSNFILLILKFSDTIWDPRSDQVRTL